MMVVIKSERFSFLMSIFGTLLFVAAIVIYVDIPVLRQYYSITEPALLAAFNLFSLFVVFHCKPEIKVHRFELTLFLFLAFVLIKQGITGFLIYKQLMDIVLLVACYIGTKCLIAQTSGYQFLVYGLAAMQIGYLIAVSGKLFGLGIISDNFFIPNKSILSILLASQLSFLIPSLFHTEMEWLKAHPIVKRSFILFSTVIGVILLIYTDGRAGWIGLAAALLYIASRYFWKLRTRLFCAFAIGLFAVALVVLFSYKPGSSNGRLLIYKVTLPMLREHWMWGVGHGQFKAKYLDYQAAFFATTDIDGNEALLADETFYAFNDYWQILIENGLISLIIFSAFLLLLVTHVIQIQRRLRSNGAFDSATASLICISVASMFSYPLQILPVLAQLLLCIAIISVSGEAVQREHKIPAFQLSAVRTALACIYTFLAIHYGYLLHFRAESHKAFGLSRTGFKMEARKIYESLKASPLIDGHFFYQYAKTLYYMNQLDSADVALKKSLKTYTSRDAYRLAARITEDKGQHLEAERYYKKTVYMVPNRMLSRFELFQFYVRRRDMTNAVFWGKSVLSMPVKVPSAITNALQQNTSTALKQLLNGNTH
jgi:tetratricopeptide (TPR) repeat protein